MANSPSLQHLAIPYNALTITIMSLKVIIELQRYKNADVKTNDITFYDYYPLWSSGYCHTTKLNFGCEFVKKKFFRNVI